MRRLLAALAPPAAALALASPAHAGTYDVHFCNSGATVFDNRSWSALASPGIVTDTACATAGTLIGIRVDAGRRSAAGAVAGLTFTSPPGTAITNFSLSRQLDYKNPVVSGTRPYFTLYQLGSVVFAGAGDYEDATRNRLNAQRSWYGYPANEAHLARGTVTRASFPALAAYRNDSRQLLLRVGCYRRNTAPCELGPGGRVYNVFYGARVTVSDPTPPASFTVEASGLMAGGPRDGSDPVTVSAADNAGIEKLEIFDLTNPAAPRVVASESYDVGPTYEAGEQRTDKGATCSYRLAKPCPDLGGETIRPSSLQVGNRNLLVRVTDAGGNYVDRGPFPVNVATPSDRGAANGSNVREPARVILRFANTRRKRQTVRFNRRIGVRGRLINADGNPIAGAELRLLTRDLPQGAGAIDRKGIRTRSDGSFRVTVRAKASRQLQLAWRARANDVRFAANGYLTLKARAAGTLRVRPRVARVGRSVRITGRLKGVRRAGVPIVLQGKLRGARRFSTFADTTSTRRGTFRGRYTFRSAGSSGRRFVFRARIRRAPGFPYETGVSRTVGVRVR
ncbi:MAG TPA: hypothetical protein VKB28_16960 [Solirubrobacteraceae bacterium]|nr:hypothetical protein [Solirubrobacteraceae bacterium]